jgi:hypothetical protein
MAITQCVFYGISTQIPIHFNNKQQKVQIARQCHCTVPKAFTRGYVALVLFLFDNVHCRINGNFHSQPIICEQIFKWPLHNVFSMAFLHKFLYILIINNRRCKSRDNRVMFIRRLHALNEHYTIAKIMVLTEKC